MTPYFPTPGLLLTLLVVSDLVLMRGRLSRERERSADRGSLRLLMIIILGSVVVAWTAARAVPQARLASVLALDAAAANDLYGLGVGIFATGLALRWLAIGWLGPLFTFDVAIARDHEVIDTGAYRFIRHPAYAGSLLAFAGVGLCGGNVVSLVLLVTPIAMAFMRRIAVEEAALATALGERYVDYASRTKRLIPFVY